MPGAANHRWSCRVRDGRRTCRFLSRCRACRRCGATNRAARVACPPTLRSRVRSDRSDLDGKFARAPADRRPHRAHAARARSLGFHRRSNDPRAIDSWTYRGGDSLLAPASAQPQRPRCFGRFARGQEDRLLVRGPCRRYVGGSVHTRRTGHQLVPVDLGSHRTRLVARALPDARPRSVVQSVGRRVHKPLQRRAANARLLSGAVPCVGT